MGTDWDKFLIPGDAVSLATNCATSKPKMGYELYICLKRRQIIFDMQTIIKLIIIVLA